MSVPVTPDGIERFAAHVANTGFEDLPDEAINAAKMFLLDTFGVGLAGSRGPWVKELIRASATGDGRAKAWGHRRVRLSAEDAAMLNAYQIHNSEFDCVHEAAVVHPMATLLGAAGTWLDGAVAPVSGRDFILATVLGVDIAAGLGVAARSPLRFFRPATAGGFAAAGAVGCLMRMDQEQLVQVFGLAYAQMCGTMQAHTEGLSLLGMQVGFNARNALVACRLASVGIPATRHTLQGDYGYFRLFETDAHLEPVLEALGHSWRITEVAHKPFPTGRATHGIVDACLTLAREHGFTAADVESVEARVPPLTHRLVGRPVRDDMTPNYGRLCGAYVAARALQTGTVQLEDFEAAALGAPQALELAARIRVVSEDHPDPNALTPIEVEIGLKDGRRHAIRMDVVYGNPARPMPREAQLEKFNRNWSASAAGLTMDAGETFIDLVERLETLPDARVLLDLLAPAG